jgi:enamine deaminase RidA (YjgF/YER057c/UK114 family)
MPKTVHVHVTEHEGRYLASTGSPWEAKIGYSRAVRVGERIFVTGTVGIEADGSYAPTAAEQARRALTIITATIRALGGDLPGVTRTRMYLTNIDDWQAVGAVHGEIFGAIRPATTLVQVAALIDKAALIEIEADAVLRPEMVNIL